MGENINKQVRVDNWGIFFLQRLQLFFSKTDYCDLTLQFQGNVQLKVHRLVLNACTEYFQLLECTDRLISENVILMPEKLQADVVVPIINFMYTGMLEYPSGIYNKLYQAAELMHIAVLIKLLDAQKQPGKQSSRLIKSPEQAPDPRPEHKPDVSPFSTLISSRISPTVKKSIFNTNNSDVPGPSTIPMKKNLWKRKSNTPTSHFSSFSPYEKHRDKFKSMQIPVREETAKPTRFEWPEDDLDFPNNMMDISGFGDISYTSKPLLREDEVKPILAQNDSDKKLITTKEECEETNNIPVDRVDKDNVPKSTSEKRKLSPTSSPSCKLPRKIKIVENEHDTTISVISAEDSSNLDPTKLVSEILKKYPSLIKKKKNIKLKILSKEKETPEVEKQDDTPPHKSKQVNTTMKNVSQDNSTENIWSCSECENNGEIREFALYYLYRKHMSDVHFVEFDKKICKYCGKEFSKIEITNFHLFAKHGIKIANQAYPSCSQCPHVAISKEALQSHKSRHKKSELQCSICKLAFTSIESISNHLQLTGHMQKIKKTIYDCQYCIKTLQSAISLLTHIKMNHEKEGIRDGIVSLDEVDIYEETDGATEETVEIDEEPEEYTVSDLSSSQGSKVKIISDVKVPPTKSQSRTEIVTLDQGKTTVSNTIATSLGLLDIVVLDDNQQYILQNQEGQIEENQTEYLLPNNVRGDSLPTTTDELVMVLTDQDYKDGHSGITTDNSNIVVLYSHPADGQQGQFITSQVEGNLMVNSETGLLEIRNGSLATTTSTNQIVVTESGNNHIETIEMIQREIDGTRNVKHYEDGKSQMDMEESDQYVTEKGDEHTPQEKKKEDLDSSTASEESPMIEKKPDDELGDVEHSTNKKDESSGEEMDSSMNVEENNEVEIMETEQSIKHRETEKTEPEEQHETKSIETQEQQETNVSVTKSDVSETSNIDRNEKIETNSENENMEEKKLEEDICIDNSELNDEMKKTESNSNPKNDECEGNDSRTIVINEVSMEIEEIGEKNEYIQRNETDEEETIESDSLNETIKSEDTIIESQKSSTTRDEEEKPYSPTDNPIDMHCEVESNVDLNDKDVESVNDDENSMEAPPPDGIERDKADGADVGRCEVQTENQENDDNSQSSHASSHTQREEDNVDNEENMKESTKISILDDWEDTDSQQSDSRTKPLKKAQETVHKLMDDWEEEEVEK